MRLPRILSFLLAFLVPITAPAEGPGGRGYRDTLLALDQQFWDASARGDVATIGRLFADDYLGIDQEQNRWTRASLLDQFRAVRTRDLRRTAEPEVLRVSDASAIVTYEARYKVDYGDRVVDSGPLRMSSCWVRRNGGWFVVFSQVSATACVPAAAEAPPVEKSTVPSTPAAATAPRAALVKPS